MLKISTWNVNSLNVRLEHVLAWLKAAQPDVLALQEIKMETEKFPHAAFHELGYHALVSGQKTYNGVALLSKKTARTETQIFDMPGYPDAQRRVLGAEIDGVYILNLYVPNGQEIGSDKYLYKLIWLNHLNALVISLSQKYQNIILLGDFNIAPNDEDVHDPAAWKDSVLVSEKERAAFNDLLKLGFIDCYKKSPRGETRFSWWDYRQAAFRRDMGLRIDHVLANTAMANRLEFCEIDKSPRTLERPSDHTPVIASFR